MKKKKKRPRLDPWKPLIPSFSRALWISQIIEPSKLGGGLGELGIHSNGATKLHAPTTIATFLLFFSFPLVPSSSSFPFLSFSFFLPLLLLLFLLFSIYYNATNHHYTMTTMTKKHIALIRATHVPLELAKQCYMPTKQRQPWGG